MIKTKINKTVVNIKFNVIIVSNSYIKQRFIINSYKNLDIKEVTDNKKFWKNIKSDFGKGDSNSEKILLLENNLIITNEKEIATIMNNFSLISRKNLDSMSSKKYATKDR